VSRIRGEERWAANCIHHALVAEVRENDDGSSPGMHDLEIVYENEPPAAVEVTAAADADSIELWNLVNGSGRWVEPDIAGGWLVALLPQARAQRLRAELPALLDELERERVSEVRVEPWSTGRIERVASELGITHLVQSGTSYPGSIYFTIELPDERSGGFVPQTGDPLARWLSGWIMQPQQAHNLRKLMDSGAQERHLFVILPGFADAPFSVVDLLMREHPPLPTQPPTLPTEVTHVWIMSTWSAGLGIRWSRDSGWQRFDKLTSS